MKETRASERTETQTTALAEPSRSTIRRWGPVAGGAVVWWALYHYNRPFWDWVIYDIVGLDPDSRLGESVHFFFYDVTKIALLLTGVIFVVTILRSFMSVERTRSVLGRTPRGRRQRSPQQGSEWSPRSARAQPCRCSSGSSPPGSRSG